MPTSTVVHPVQNIGGLFCFAVGVGGRRLHDTNRSGCFLFLHLIPIIRWIILIVWYLQKGDEGSNQYNRDANIIF